jgi:hypothetical protein
MPQQFRVRDRRTERRYFVDNVIIRGYGWIIGPIGIAVYNGLCLYVGADVQDCWSSHQTFADLIGASKSAVKRYLKLLRDLLLVDWHSKMCEDGSILREYSLLDPPSPPDVDEFVYPDYVRKKPAKKWMTWTATRKRRELERQVAARDGCACYYCGVEIILTEEIATKGIRHEKRDRVYYICPEGKAFATLDHVVPRSAGGATVLENLVLACGVCNVRKGTKDVSVFLADSEHVPAS